MLKKIKRMLLKTSVGVSVMCDLENFECEITPERILEELEYTLEKVEQDGWENHLENPQQVKSLKCLIKNVKKLIVSECKECM